MISDVLSDAEDNIRDYLRVQPEVYVEERDAIEALLAQMAALRMWLDGKPFDAMPLDANRN